MIFLIKYERSSGKLLSEPIAFSDADQAHAQAQRLASELENAGNLDREILLMHADTLGDLKKNHGRFFSSIDELKHRIELDPKLDVLT